MTKDNNNTPGAANCKAYPEYMQKYSNLNFEVDFDEDGGEEEADEIQTPDGCAQQTVAYTYSIGDVDGPFTYFRVTGSSCFI